MGGALDIASIVLNCSKYCAARIKVEGASLARPSILLQCPHSKPLTCFDW